MWYKRSQDQHQVQMNPKTTMMMNLYHNHEPSPSQCSSILVQTIEAPLALVWSMVRNFKNPQAYKRFIKSCILKSGDGEEGSVREITVISGLPARTSTERLDRLDDDSHVMVFSIIGGDHRLANYRSIVTVHEDHDQEEGGRSTVVIESYMVDVPPESCKEDTRLFADTIIGYNHKSLAKVAENKGFIC